MDWTLSARHRRLMREARANSLIEPIVRLA